jgi:hypothetical protein
MFRKIGEQTEMRYGSNKQRGPNPFWPIVTAADGTLPMAIGVID